MSKGIMKYNNYPKRAQSEGEAVKIFMDAFLASCWNRHLVNGALGFALDSAYEGKVIYFWDLDSAKKGFMESVEHDRGAAIYIAGKDSDGEWEMGDGDPLFVYKFEDLCDGII